MTFKWTKNKQDAFNKIKRIMEHNTLLTYPYFNEEFNIYTSARNFQLGAAITQKMKLMNLYGRKLTDSQKSYSLTKRELLRILKTPRGFRDIT